MPTVTGGAPDVSVILPSYRAAAVAQASAARLVERFHAWGLVGEVIVVDDGGGDFDAEPSGGPPYQLLSLPRNRGKGAAVRAGVGASRGAVVAYTDVDLPYGCEPIFQAHSQISQRGFHLVLGDRWLPGSTFVQPRSPARRLLSRVSASAIGTYLTGGFADTQCGFKALEGALARSLFAKFIIDGFAFEVELLQAALALGLDIKRLPVSQAVDGPSSVRLFHHGTESLRDLLRLRRRRHQILDTHSGTLSLIR